MTPFTFQSPSNILFEAGASRKIAELVEQYGASRIMLVTDKGVRAAGLTGDAEAALSAARISVTIFDGVVADPPSQVIESAGRALPGPEDRTGAVNWWWQRAGYGKTRRVSREIA